MKDEVLRSTLVFERGLVSLQSDTDKYIIMATAAVQQAQDVPMSPARPLPKYVQEKETTAERKSVYQSISKMSAYTQQSNGRTL